MDIDKLTLGEAKKKMEEYKELARALNKETHSEDAQLWEVGKPYFIRTVTMHLMGVVKKVTDKEILLGEASWIADNGRFSDFIAGKYDTNLEVEPFGDQDVIVNRNSLIDAVQWKHKLLTEQK